METLNKIIELFSTSSPVARLTPTIIAGLPIWAQYTFGSLLLIIGLLLLALTPINNRAVKEYKAKQLKEYKIQNKIKTNISYESTKMFLPFGQRFKQIYGPILGITFVVIGLSWIIGQTIL